MAIHPATPIICLSFLVWVSTVVIYRLFFHPLAKIPGPKLAAITQLYQTFYCYYGGKSRFYRKIDQLHDQYGPVVRITPSEVALNDPDNYAKIYHMGTKYYKSPDYYRVFGAPAAFFTTVENRLHAARRSPLNPFFSRKSVLALEPLVQEKARTLLTRLDHDLAVASRTGDSVELHDLFSAFSIDVASDYSFHDCYGLLDVKGYGSAFSSMVRGVLKSFWFFMQFPALEKMALSLPSWFSSTLSPALKEYNNMVEETRRNVNGVKSQVDSGLAKPLRRSIFHELLAVEPGSQPTVDDMTDIALTIVVAAAAATGNALAITAFHVLKNEDIYRRLRAELETHFPDPSQNMRWADLEKLPYLTAVIKEGLRLSYGVIGRLPRVVPQPGAVFNGHCIPAGSIVGMSSWTMHRNPASFPDPDRFDPTRWLDPVRSKQRDRHLVSFGKDGRQCIGMPLAYCELYVMAGALFRHFDNLEVRGTQRDDLEFDDYFSGYHPEKARPLRVGIH